MRSVNPTVTQFETSCFDGSYITGALAGLLMFLVAALMATVSIIVISAAKIMIGVLVIFAPVAIACTLFKVTAPLFDRWVNLALGFAFYPMLTSGMAAFTIAIARDLTPASLASVETIGDVLSFVVVMMLGTGLMAMVPTIAQSLASTATGLGSQQNQQRPDPLAPGLHQVLSSGGDEVLSLIHI